MATDWSGLTVDILPSMTLLELLKSYLGITGTEDDVALTLALNQTGPAVERYLDRVIAQREKVENFARHFGTVVLHDLPVAEPVVVTLDGVEQTDYEWFKSRGDLAHVSRIGTSWDMPLDWRKYEQATITYTAGYMPIPADLAQAITYAASDMYKSEGTGSLPGGGSGGSGDVKSLTLYDVGSVTYDVGSSTSGSSGGVVSGSGVLNETVTNMIESYRRIIA